MGVTELAFELQALKAKLRFFFKQVILLLW